jgi:hypothetical protein
MERVPEPIKFVRKTSRKPFLSSQEFLVDSHNAAAIELHPNSWDFALVQLMAPECFELDRNKG